MEDDMNIRCHHPKTEKCIYADKIVEGVYYCAILRDTVFRDGRPCPFHRDTGSRWEWEEEEEDER